MTISSQQYAGLASDSYDTSRAPGARPPAQEERVRVDGVEFKVLEQYDNPNTGYQGTIYQHVDTDELVVAHRGTEFDREAIQDGLIADGGMVLKRANTQVSEALALTQRAIDRAQNMASRYGHAPEVTITGHSLGGTLAQITAAKLGLRGEAFNPYGAVSLNYGVSEGGHRFINHVMAGDTVSAASPHHGQVRMYATAKEVAAVTAAGYGRLNPMPDNSLLAAGLAMGVAGSHNMDNFLSVDSKRRPDISVLDDPTSRKLAERHSDAFGDYRQDVRLLRGGISLGGDIMQRLNGSGQSVDPVLPPDALRNPLPKTFVPFTPEHLRDFRHPNHTENRRYQEILGEVGRMEEANGIAPGPHSERMVAAWLDELQRNRDFPALDRFEVRGRDVVAVARWDNIFAARRELVLDTDAALSRSVEQVSMDWAQRVMPHLGQPQLGQEPAIAVVPEHDLRHPDYIKPQQHKTLRDRIEATYAEAGIVRSGEQLDQATAAVAQDMQKYGLTRADTISLLRDADGAIQPDGGLAVQQGQYPLMLRSITPGEALQQTAEQSFQQLQQVAMQQSAEQQQQMAAMQQRTPVMG